MVVVVVRVVVVRVDVVVVRVVVVCVDVEVETVDVVCVSKCAVVVLDVPVMVDDV